MKQVLFLSLICLSAWSWAKSPSQSTNGGAKKPDGKALYVQNCASCHGENGKSETDIGKALKARNLVSDMYKQVADKQKKVVTEADVLGTLKTGVPGTGMASFGHLPPNDLAAIAAYVISLRK